MLFSRLGSLSVARTTSPPAAPLTQREHEIAALVSRGLPNKAIARQIGLSGATIKNHVHNILQKLNIQCRGEMATLLVETRRVPRPPIVGPKHPGPFRAVRRASAQKASRAAKSEAENRCLPRKSQQRELLPAHPEGGWASCPAA